VRQITEPTPRTSKQKFKKQLHWPIISIENFQYEKLDTSLSFEAVLKGRRTSRNFKSLDKNTLLSFIRQISRPQFLCEKDEFERKMKAAISAGALHPIDILVLSGNEINAPILYDDDADLFLNLDVKDKRRFHEFSETTDKIIPEGKGHILLFVGDIAKTSEAYNNSESLLWRDAGALLQLFSMAAYSYGFEFCPLGILGIKALNSITPTNSNLVAVGTGIIGILK